jgi:ribulose-bisphosphate carboxylase large chain
LDLGDDILSQFPGPSFGIAGLRDIVGVYDKPLLCTALKPMGKSATELAKIAYYFALGGVDVIKDDHGLSNQPFCPYGNEVMFPTGGALYSRSADFRENVHYFLSLVGRE